MPAEEGKEIKLLIGRLRYEMILIIVLAVVLLDQLSKFFASRFLQLNIPVPVIKNFLNFTLVHNRGAAFGFLQNQFFLFVLVTLFTIGLILFNLKNKTNSNVFKLSLSLILGGAVGNLVDRLRFGFVVDFLDLRVWPVFNIADSMITIAALFLIWEIIFNKNAA